MTEKAQPSTPERAREIARANFRDNKLPEDTSGWNDAARIVHDAEVARLREAEAERLRKQRG